MLNNLFSKTSSREYSKETIDILRLFRSENVGPRTFINLIKLFGSATIALENIKDFASRGGRERPITVFSKSAAESEIEKLNKNKSYLITYKDLNYSYLLKQIHDFPPVLSYKGNIELLNSTKIIAIVGARNSSMNGRSFASKIASELVSAGFITASGLARGIDTAVHNSSIQNTIAVIAGGIDHIYPPENIKLFAAIAEKSLILSELPIGSKPLSQHFPQRNRIISGVARATVVIEAGLKSGSLITAHSALNQNREVYAVPGFPLDPRCVGTNRLIKEGAILLESSNDIISNIIPYEKLKKSFEEGEYYGNNFKYLASNSGMDVKDSHRKMIKDLLSSYPVTYEDLSDETSLPMPIIYTVCLELELADKIQRHAGNKISLIYM
jgi:DNA processing protein